MADLAKIKSNVAKMISMNAPESDIDGYIASEGVTVDDVRDFGKDYTGGRLYTIDRGLSFGMGRKLQGLFDAAVGKLGDLGESSGEIIANIRNKGLKEAFSDVEGKPTFWERYHNTVDPINEKIAEYQRNKPIEATAVELGSGIFNPANKLGIGYIKKGASTAAKVARSSVVGGGVGSVAGGMNTEHTEDLPENIALGTATGTALGAALPIAGKFIGGVYNKGKALLAPEASVAGKETGLGNIVKDNDSVRILKRGVMAGDDVANQVSEQAPSVMDSLNKEMSDIIDNTMGRKLDYEKAIENEKERLGNFIARNSEYPVFTDKNPNINSDEANPFEMLVNPREYNRVAKKEQAERGDSLLTYIVKNGGIKDVGGDLKNMDAGKQRIGIINNKSGRSADDVALSAWENGYFPEKTSRPTINDLQEAISEELFGNKRFPGLSKQGLTEATDQLAEAMQQLGIDYRGMSAQEAERAYNNAVNSWDLAHNGGSVNPFIEEVITTNRAQAPYIGDMIRGLNKFQRESLETALAKGVDHSSSPRGSLGATHKAQEVLNDMIDASYDTKNPFKPRATTETRDLEQVKKRVNQILEPSGVKEFDASYSKAKALQAAFDKGYTFKPSDIKFSSLGLKTLREKRSFLQGYLRKVKENVLSDGGTNLADAVRKTENVLKEVLPAKKVDKILGEANRINREFGRLKKLSQIADTKLDKPLAVDRPASERWEGLGAWLGSLQDKANSAMWTNSNRRRALALLNGIGERQRQNIIESRLRQIATMLGLPLNATIIRQQNRKD